MNEIIDKDKCSQCKGKCCQIYRSVFDGGMRLEHCDFQEHCEGWDEMFKEYGADKAVAPLFDPLIVHMNGNDHMWESLVERGIDPNSCVYLGKNGCLLPRENRPKVCREYMCKEKL